MLYNWHTNNTHLSGVSDGVQDVAGAGVPLEPDHGRALPDAAHAPASAASASRPATAQGWPRNMSAGHLLPLPLPLLVVIP